MKASIPFVVIFLMLLTAGFVTAWMADRPEKPEVVASRIATNVGHEIEVVQADLEPLLQEPFALEAALRMESTYPFHIFRDNRLLFWSDNTFVPSAQLVRDPFDIRVLGMGRESFLLKKDRIDERTTVVSVIALRREYPITNDYLSPEWNDRIFPAPGFSILQPEASVGLPICLDGQCLFRVSFLPQDVAFSEPLRMVAVILIGLALVMLFVIMLRALPRLTAWSAEGALVLLAVSLLALRVVMTWFRFPADYVPSDFFNPQVFASSWINASLGDFLLNMLVILVLCIYLFRNYFRMKVMRNRGGAVRHGVVGVLAGLCILFGWLFPYIVIQTISNNSAMTLSISQSLQFDGLRIAAFIIVVLSGVSAFLFVHPFISMLSRDTRRLRSAAMFAVATGLFVAINEWTGQAYMASLACGALNFFVVYLLRLHRNLKRLSYGTFAYLFVGIFFLALVGAAAVQRFTQKEKIQSQFRFASSFLIDRDIFAEYLLNEAAANIAQDAFVQMRFMSPFLGKEPVRQKIRQVFLPTYLNKYDVRIHLFNSFGVPIDDPAGPTLGDWVQTYGGERFQTEFENLFFITGPESDVTHRYLMIVPVSRVSTTYGYVLVELSLKKIIPQTVYPELLVDRTFQQFYHTRDMNYAVFAGKELIYSSGSYNYENFFNRSWLGDPRLYTVGLAHDGYDHIAQEDQTSRIAVVSVPVVPFNYQVANFSFLFVLGLFIILVLIFIQGVYHYVLGRRLFFSARIQLYLNLAFFVPLILVSLTTLGLTSRSSQNQLSGDYLSRSRALGQQLTGVLQESAGGGEEGRTLLTSELADLAKLSNLEANVYNTRGELAATSQPLIFESNLLAPYMSAHAYFRILGGENQLIVSEQVGSLRFFVAYTAIQSPRTGALTAILGIPFFQAVHMLEQMQTTILANILNIFAVICIVLLLLSYFVSEWLTFPLRFITQSLRKTSLTRINNPLTWTAQDEIGMMVREYNAMLFKLDESKVELENTQREKAWREIAQQVAHEIKNPLTPMKLTLQQLERAIRDGNTSPERTRKAIENLLSQVDTLNDIASSFSGFAKMPEPVIAPLDAVALLKRIVDLHSPTGEIRLRTAVREGWVMGDEQLLGRTFSNLILNGMQSGHAGQATRVSVRVRRDGNTLQMSFTDNGAGIDPAIADRIFLPHFSTKKSGSGLGLAISRQAVHQMKGRIYFETEQDKGTTFTVELPLTL